LHGVVFPHPGPALSVIQIDCLPGAAAVSVELEVIVDSGNSATRFGSNFESYSSAGVLVDEEFWLSGQRDAPSESRYSQVVRSIEKASTMLSEAGIGSGDIVSTRHFMRHDTQFETDPSEWLDFKKDSTPTSAGIAVSGVGDPDHHFVFELEAVKAAGSNRTNLRTGRSFEVEHNYCRAVRVVEGEVVYVAGTTSIIPGETVQHPYEVGPQVADTLEIIRWAIEELGLEWDDLVQARNYVVGGPEKLAEAIGSLESTLDTGSIAC
jgi:enamine deaminase RidA (YjgF/YER057c/UK114 family)